MLEYVDKIKLLNRNKKLKKSGNNRTLTKISKQLFLANN